MLIRTIRKANEMMPTAGGRNSYHRRMATTSPLGAATKTVIFEEQSNNSQEVEMSVSGIFNMHNAYDGSFLTLMIVANFVQGFR